MLAPAATAQDDMYFTPKKKDKKEAALQAEMPAAVDYAYGGQTRDVDEYNRRGVFAGSYYEIGADSLQSDVIDFYADTTRVDTAAGYAYGGDEDYKYSRALSRYDDFYWYDPLYDPWAYSWYGPYGWYGRPYGWYAGWWYDPWLYDPWFYGPYRPWGWHYPAYVYVPHYRRYRGLTGTSNHGRPGRRPASAYRDRPGYRGTADRQDGIRNNRVNRNNRLNINNRPNFNNRPSIQSRPSINRGNTFRGGRVGGSFRGGGSFGSKRR